MIARSFDPIADRHAETLVLGSMPGVRSLAAGQYYAHPQNAFWRIVSELLHLPADASYRVRTRALVAARIALWDVLASCERPGSLDTMIRRETEIANDFKAFFAGHPGITRVFFNGAKAEASFRRHVLPHLGHRTFHFARLPSTSPAHASLPFAAKLEAWRAILRPRP
ncbi:MAG: DNA-deoxyinosine glycosylase [Betaproteobacteria bacterium]|nr:DNA-deoxyinosine glycosylase [Betaproteobacteria bacterium]